MNPLFGGFTTNVVDPRLSPYFTGQEVGDQMQTLGQGSGYGYLNALQGLPGAEAYYTAPMGGDRGDGGSIDPQALQAYLEANGLQLIDEPNGNGGTRYLVNAQGQVVGEPEQYTNEDRAFGNMATLAALVTGANLYGAGFLGGGLEGGLSISPAEAGFGQWPAGMGDFSFLPASGAEGGIGTLGTIAPGAGEVAAMAPMGAGALSTSLPAIAGPAAMSAPSLLSTLGSANSLANLGSAAIGLYGQNKAIGAMQDATNQANDFNRYAFDQIRADNKPLVDLRNSVLPQIQSLLANPGSVMNDPGNQFQFAQGVKARENSAAGRGMTYSGAQAKALTQFGQDFASTKLDDSLRRLQSVAGLGQVGNNQSNQATANFAGNAAGNALGMGAARSSAYGNAAGMANNALLNIFDQSQYRNLWGGGS